MKVIRNTLCVLVLSTCVSTQAQITKGNLNDKNQYQQGSILTPNEMQLVNKYNVPLDFKYSYDKQNWEVMKLAKNDYILVRFTANRNYFYVRLCTTSPFSNMPACEDYRLQRQKRYLFNWESEKKAYSIRVLKE